MMIVDKAGGPRSASLDMDLLNSVVPKLFWVVVLAFPVVQAVDSGSVEPEGGIETMVICENGHGGIHCPDGKITIKNAYYGRTDAQTCPSEYINDKNCKATNALDIIRVKCESKPECHLEATNNFFGDPCPNTYKYLKIDYICRKDDPIHSELICENDSKKISCPEGKTIKIKNATYGRMDADVCPNQKLNCRAENTLSIVNKRCQNREECLLEATNKWLTDPCIGTHKYLSVEYQCVQGFYSELICENNSKKISCPEATTIEFTNASYGRMDKNICPVNYYKTTDCRAEGTLSIVNKRCKHMKQCLLEANNNWFTDPCVGTYKYLSAKYHCVQGVYSELICENNSKKIRCPTGMTIVVKNAFYGRMDKYICPVNVFKTTYCRAEDTLSIVNKRCENKKECLLEATNKWLTDPCIGTYKYLSVEYQCTQG